MKVFRRIVIWALISLTIQFAGLFYIDRYFLSSNTGIKAKKVIRSEPKKSDIAVSIPDNAKNISPSFDGRYVAYYDGNILDIVDTETGYKKQVKFEDGVKMSFYKWLPDRNRMLIVEKQNSYDGANFRLEYFEVDKNIKENIKTLEGFNTNTEVDDIKESPLTNVIYMRMQSAGRRTSIYRINIMNEMQKVKTNSYMIGDIEILSLKDKLIYEDSIYNKIYITGEDRSIDIEEVENPVLLGVDNSDRVYIGSLKDDKISEIHYGNAAEDISSYQNINLGEAADKNDIHISSSGNIYVNDNLRGVVKDITSGKEYIYHGKFIQMYNRGIISVSDGKLSKTLVD
ncbi:MAG: hypothetical protein LKE46_02130 [Clostridium sp.]|jgi:hypothetical protein|uniref:hypothetical protein n=1 Tax=Clostridium sp. TaxID=1506 RepID=UPI0025C583EB|nr:hypothetical protein [Clostridium sp.]MCH3963047.1 hypothetical protein [Clostridium sp.]MCI1716490.1 hypothetical protein [Clostridium sp.]MCI1800830.1 hypothetical protein [Clostridium sp.]MCI1814515.1 hypothetical protein [Clostridium sp.]MCI1871425.1 hypothetical protein [Clostridium sp.]